MRVLCVVRARPGVSIISRRVGSERDGCTMNDVPRLRPGGLLCNSRRARPVKPQRRLEQRGGVHDITSESPSLRATSAKINFSYSILFHLTTSYSSYFEGKKGISRNKTSFFLLMDSRMFQGATPKATRD